jgi:hypothetical protein
MYIPVTISVSAACVNQITVPLGVLQAAAINQRLCHNREKKWLCVMRASRCT